MCIASLQVIAALKAGARSDGDVTLILERLS